tara:strand:+ start:530 stop:724 length:195 start_codon:yes stop_codon:yes gene_type:complete
MVHPIMKAIFKKREDQDEKLIKNMEEYAKKEKTKQSESQVLGQKQVKRTTNKEKDTSVHNSPRV